MSNRPLRRPQGNDSAVSPGVMLAVDGAGRTGPHGKRCWRDLRVSGSQGRPGRAVCAGAGGPGQEGTLSRNARERWPHY